MTPFRRCQATPNTKYRVRKRKVRRANGTLSPGGRNRTRGDRNTVTTACAGCGPPTGRARPLRQVVVRSSNSGLNLLSAINVVSVTHSRGAIMKRLLLILAAVVATGGIAATPAVAG